MKRILMAVCLFSILPIVSADEPMPPVQEKETKQPAANDASEDRPLKDPRLDRETPEGTLRIFLIGMMLSNEQLIKATVIPVTDEEMKVLLGKPQAAPVSAKEIKEQFAEAKINVIKPGDKFSLPNGKEIVFPKEERPGEEMVLHVEDSPLPFRLHLHKKIWWVDAQPVIDARKAARKKK